MKDYRIFWVSDLLHNKKPYATCKIINNSEKNMLLNVYELCVDPKYHNVINQMELELL